MKRTILTFLAVLFVLATSAQVGVAREFNIRDYGAVGDGAAFDSPAIQKAIDACTASGGGTVIVPAGNYLSGTLMLKDNVTLRLEEGALLSGATELDRYEWIDEFTEGLGIRVGRTFVCAVDAKNVAIEGEGTIDGRGSEVKAKHIETDTRPEGRRWGERPFLLRIIRCDGVRVEGVTLKYSASWTSHYQQSKNIDIHGVTIESRGVAHNDGIGIDGCSGVRISDCDVDSGDDALVFKTTHSAYPCSDIVVEDMRLKSNQAGIKMGTESMAAFENISISRCHIYDTRNGGIKLFSVDGARMRNITVSDVTMDNIRTPIMLRLGARLSVFRGNEDTRQPVGFMRDVTIRNVRARSDVQTQLTSASGILITGIAGHPIERLTMDNIEISLPGGGTVEEGRHEVPEAVDQYPEVKTFGPTIPACGVWMRHVDGVEMSNIAIKTDVPDLRPVFVAEDARNVNVTSLEASVFGGSESAVRLKDCRNVRFATEGLEGEGAATVTVCDDAVLIGSL